MTGETNEQPEAHLGPRPAGDKRDDKGELEGDMRGYPEPAAGNAAAIRLDQLGLARPERIHDGEFIEAAAEAHQGQGGRARNRQHAHFLFLPAAFLAGFLAAFLAGFLAAILAAFHRPFMRPSGSVKSDSVPMPGTSCSSTWILPPAATIFSR